MWCDQVDLYLLQSVPITTKVIVSGDQVDLYLLQSVPITNKVIVSTKSSLCSDGLDLVYGV